MFISDEHLDRVKDTYLDGAADLAIEVVSIDSLVRDQHDKFLEYQSAGVREYWLIDEYHERARFYLLDADGQYQQAALSGDGAYASTVLPGLRLPIKGLWHEPFASFREALAGRSPDPTLPVRRSSLAAGVSPYEQHVVWRAPVTTEANGRGAATSYAPPLVSWEDFLAWVQGIEGRAEWVDGEIVELMPESLRNFDLIEFLIDLLRSHVRRHGLGRVYFLEILMRLALRPSGRMPDIMFVSNEHLNQRRGTYLDGPANLVVEVVSPDSEVRDRFIKLGEYQDAGIPEYWLIDDRRHEAHFYVLGADGKYQDTPLAEDGVYTSAVLPGLRLKVEWLWRDPLPTLNEALADLPD